MEFIQWLENKYGYTGGQEGLQDEYTVYELHWLRSLFSKEK